MLCANWGARRPVANKHKYGLHLLLQVQHPLKHQVRVAMLIRASRRRVVTIPPGTKGPARRGRINAVSKASAAQNRDSRWPCYSGIGETAGGAGRPSIRGNV